MRIALVGGTGDIGEGLALRWGLETDHELVVGSRDPKKARRRAAEYRDRIEERGAEAAVSGASNDSAVEGADVIVFSVPAAHLTETLDAVSERLAEGCIVVVPAVSMSRDGDGFHLNAAEREDSTTLAAATAAPDRVSVVGAFHNIAAGRLANLDAALEVDTLVVADDSSAAETVSELAEQINGIRALDAGSLANAREIEGLTPLLINIAVNNDGMHDLGVRFQ